MIQTINDSIKTVAFHYRTGNLNYPMIIYISLVHVAAIIGLFTIQRCSWQTLLWTFILWPISGLGITAGAHRLWAHRSYKATLPLRIFLMLCNSIANQGSIYHWSRDHRVHHKYSEADADPHNATRGFFYAHMGWLFVRKHPATIAAGKQLDYTDLAKDTTVVFQRYFDPWFALFMCFVLPGLVCTLWGDNFWNGYWVAGALRYVFVLHCTWCVNSAAHFFGTRPYDAKLWPAENFWVAVGAIGEGWHNWHHKYPYDYATSEFGVWKQYNPTKAFIDMCCLLGLAYDCKRATGSWSRTQMKREKEAAALAAAGGGEGEKKIQ